MKGTVEREIDAVIARRVGPPRFSLADTSAWLAPFEARLPFRLPPSFASLVRRYRFSAFDCRGVTVFGNVSGAEYDDLVMAVVRDPVIADVTHRHGFLQMGRPSTGSYDPVCFDMRRRSKSAEGPLVRAQRQ